MTQPLQEKIKEILDAFEDNRADYDGAANAITQLFADEMKGVETEVMKYNCGEHKKLLALIRSRYLI